jgi:hypothetical protein
VRSGLAWAAVMVALAAGCRGQWPVGSPVSEQPASSVRTTCAAAQLRLSAGPDVSPATGQNPEAIRLTNTGPRCVLAGYPVLRFTDADGAAIPFRLSRSDDQMVTAHRARPVVVAHGRSAWIVLNKYRCDLGRRSAAGQIVVRLAGAGRIGVIPPDSAGWAYCGPGDPGSTVHVSPLEPRLLAALRQR